MQRPRLERHRLQDERRRRRHGSPLRVAYSNSTASQHVTIGNPSPVVVDGAVVMIFCRNNKQVMTLRSADGIQWDGAPTDVTAQALGANWSARVDWIATGPPQGLVLPSSDGAERIVIQANYRGSGTAADVGFTILSDDGGDTWRPSAGIVRATRAGGAAQNGSLIMNCTDALPPPFLSDDRSDSWSPPISYWPPENGSCEGRGARRLTSSILEQWRRAWRRNGATAAISPWSSADSGETCGATGRRGPGRAGVPTARAQPRASSSKRARRLEDDHAADDRVAAVTHE